MVAGAERMAGVEAELNALMRAPFKIPALQPFPVDAVKNTEVPGEDVNPEVLFALAEFIEKRNQRAFAANAIVAQKLRIAVELPAGKQDEALGGFCRGAEGTIVVAAVNQ